MPSQRIPEIAEIGIRGGLDVRIPGAPRQSLRQAGEVRTVAISGHDFPGVRPEFRCAVGDAVRAGQTIFVDRKRPDIAFTAPVSGTVSEIRRGRRRSLDVVVIRMDGDASEHFAVASGASSARDLLIASGLWPSFLTRPFGRIPDADAEPDAIFVTAMDTSPLAADPKIAIGLHQEEFRRGLELVEHLTDGPVYVCHAPGTLPGQGTGGRTKHVAFSGRHPAGLPGTHVHHLAPVGNGRSVWTIDAQGIIAIGHLALNGTIKADRIVALAGPGVRDPALVRVKSGSSLDELLVDQLTASQVRVISGSVLAGRESGYLGHYHNQVTVLADGAEPGSGFARRWSQFLRGPRGGAIVPREAFERVLPLDILPVPLMRALSIGDVETAHDLGCLELVEEDLALLSRLCTTGADYGGLLRQVLDELEGRR